MLAKSTLPTIWAVLGSLLGGAVAAGADAPVPLHRFPVRTMGTEAVVAVAGPDSTALAERIAPALARFARVDSLLSNWTETSEVARINRVLDATPRRIHPEAGTVVGAALRIGSESGGAFDITVEPLVRAWGFLRGSPRVPDPAEIAAARARTGQRHLRWDPRAGTLATDRPGLRVDLGGIAKGHAVDRVAEDLAAAGIEVALVDLSGNMRGLGAPAGRATWTVGVRDPADRVPWFATLALHDDAVATSADYEQFVAGDGRRYGHILDPRTGWPAEGLAAVTVLAPTALAADAWATALFASGPDAGRALAAARDDLHAILVHRATDGPMDVWVESSLGDRFALRAGMETWFRVHRF